MTAVHMFLPKPNLPKKEEPTSITLEPGQSAIILDAEGNLVSSYIPKMEEDDFVPRGALITTMLLCITPERLDALIEEIFPGGTDRHS